MLGTRLVTGLTMAGITLAVLFVDEWLAPWFPLWLIVTVAASSLAAAELAGLLGETAARPSGRTVVGGVLALVVSNWFPHVLAYLHHPHADPHAGYDPLAPVNALAWPLLAFIAVVMATFVLQSVRFVRPGSTMVRIAGTVLAVAYVGLLGSVLIQMRWLDGPYHGVLPLLYLLMSAKGADTGAYTVGRVAGRHKLWPKLSPNKTVEGAVGGLAFAVGGALVVGALARYVLRVPTLGWGSAVVFGLVIGVSAQLGDLMESMIKRDCERKDASSTLPGFGGVLDVLDSLLFSAPVAFAVWLALGA